MKKNNKLSQFGNNQKSIRKKFNTISCKEENAIPTKNEIGHQQLVGYFPVQTLLLLILCCCTFITQAATFTVINTNDTGLGSLRQAMTDANATAAADVIEFNISGAGVHTIVPMSPLPTQTKPVLIDGSTQPGYATTPLIEIDGTNIPSWGSGFYFANNSNSGLKALCVHSCANRGIYMVNSSTMTIEDCIVGMDPTGTIAKGNVGLGINFTGDGLTITGSVVTNNEGGGFQTVGGDNVIIENCIFGLDITGTAAHPPTGVSKHGIEARASQGVTIRNNIVSANTGHGMFLSGVSTDLLVEFNKIGTDITGNIDMGNVVEGINLSSYLPAVVNDNVIAGNGRYGISASNNSFTFLRNRVGIGVNGANLGNDNSGVYLIDQGAFQFNDSKVGDGTAANANIIAYNGVLTAGGDGVSVRQLGTNNIPIVGNIIHDNADLGIDLNINGVTSNDAGDADAGANNLLNFPVINSGELGSLIVDFDLDVPAGDYRIEVFGIPAGSGDPSTHGEGNTFLGFFNINHPGSGAENFVETIAGAVAINAGDSISLTTTLCTDATCTDFAYTSEFSELARVNEPCDPNIFHQAIKRVGAPTICDVLTTDPNNPLGTMDCDGGGIDNLTECQAGGDPENPTDDLPLSCYAGPGSTYHLGFDNHAFEIQQISGNPMSGTFPIGLVEFEDCMLPQPTPATITATGLPFCMGGIKDANLITSTNWNVANLGGCGNDGLTQKGSDNPTVCEVVIDKGLPTEQVFAVSQVIANPGANLTATDIKDALNATGVLPACMTASGATVAGISTDEASCVDFLGANWQYAIDCSCLLPSGEIPTSFTVKVCQDSGDYANYLMKLL